MGSLLEVPRAAEPPALSGDRILGLDAWRAILMIGGIIFHASILKRERTLFLFTEIVSGSFRMGAFFLLSGLLSGYALSRRDPGDWLRRRVLRLGVPAVFGILVICPLLNLAITAQLGHGFPLFCIHHLWFLVALLLYTALVFCLEDLERQSGLVSRLVARGEARPRVQAELIGIVATSSFLLMWLSAHAAPRAAGPFSLTPGLQIFGDAPMFLLGYLLSRSPSLRDAAAGRRTLPLAIVIGTFAAYAAWYGGLARSFDGGNAVQTEFFLRIAGASLCAPAAAMLILHSALRITRVSPLVTRLSEASFTIYIVHYPIMALLNLGFKKIHWHPYLEYLVAMMLGGLASYAIHRLIVRMSRLARFLVNGTPLRSAPPLACRLAA